MADNELVFEEGAVYLYALPNFPPELLLCTANIAGDEKLLTGWYSEWDKGDSFDAKYLRKLAPSVHALVEQVVPFGF